MPWTSVAAIACAFRAHGLWWQFQKTGVHVYMSPGKGHGGTATAVASPLTFVALAVVPIEATDFGETCLRINSTAFTRARG